MSESMSTRYASVLRGMRDACARVGRNSEDVRLVAVSKTVGEELIRELHGEGQRDFAESRVQEALPKIVSLPDDVVWHFIGRIQRNKARRIVAEFPYIHSVDSWNLACFMNGIAGEIGVKPRVFLQVNLAEEEAKGGFGVSALEAAASQLLSLPHLKIIGLMCLPPFSENPEGSRPHFRRLRELRDKLACEHCVALPHLSMGMSHDYAVAIEEGATFVRVGSSLFGERSYSSSLENSEPSKT